MFFVHSSLRCVQGAYKCMHACVCVLDMLAHTASTAKHPLHTSNLLGLRVTSLGACLKPGVHASARACRPPI